MIILDTLDNFVAKPQWK